MAQWQRHLPTVVPHYAVKSNNDHQVLRWLREVGVRYDCASPAEIKQVLKAGATPDDIIYANPCKSHADIRVAKHLGVPITVVDSPEEVEKLAEIGMTSTLIRLKVPDAASAQPFSRKFGAPLSWVPDILHALRISGIRHAGWSFHVGSLCGEPQQFSRAIEVCAEASAIAYEKPDIIDIGGGFIHEPIQFETAAAEIRRAQKLFDYNTRWIGEPGRFFSGPVATLHVPVIGVKNRHDGGGKIYTIDDSVYGTFSNIPFDGQKPVYEPLDPKIALRPPVRATLFGRTCDSADCLAEDIELPELRVGDVLKVRNMGAYTSVSASYFNGFPMPDRVYDVDT